MKNLYTIGAVAMLLFAVAIIARCVSEPHRDLERLGKRCESAGGKLVPLATHRGYVCVKEIK